MSKTNTAVFVTPVMATVDIMLNAPLNAPSPSHTLDEKRMWVTVVVTAVVGDDEATTVTVTAARKEGSDRKSI